ncbi:MAG: hypothetical protein ABL874_10680 [Sphingopyxis sp.]
MNHLQGISQESKTMIAKKFITISIGLTALGCASAALAEWRLLGQREVSDRAETDVISLPGGRNYDHIRICAYRNPVHIIDADVHFRNGGHQDVALAARLRAGDCSRSVELEGGQRDIERIVLRYEETSRRRARASVRVFGE